MLLDDVAVMSWINGASGFTVGIILKNVSIDLIEFLVNAMHSGRSGYS